MRYVRRLTSVILRYTRCSTSTLPEQCQHTPLSLPSPPCRHLTIIDSRRIPGPTSWVAGAPFSASSSPPHHPLRRRGRLGRLSQGCPPRHCRLSSLFWFF